MNKIVLAVFAVFCLLQVISAAPVEDPLDVQAIVDYIQSMQFQKRGDSAFSTNGMSRQMNMMSRYGGGRWRGDIGLHG